MRALLADVGADLERLEAVCASSSLSWSDLAVPLEQLTDRVGRTWGAVQHLSAVNDHAELRAAVEAAQPSVVAFGLRVSSSTPLYLAFRAMRDDAAAWSALTPAQRRVAEAQMREAELAGVALKGEHKARFEAIQLELGALSTSFSNNVLDATKGFTRVVTAAAEVAGLPLSALELAAQSAVAAGHAEATAADGPWALTLDGPSFLSIMKHASSRAVREEVYRAYVTRASAGESDNLPLIVQMLGLRHEMASLLGFEHYAAVSLASKAATLVGATELLSELRAAALEPARREHAELEAFARDRGANHTLRQWDVAYFAERMVEERFDLEEEALRPFFPLENVLGGLFALCERLFDVTITSADGEAPVWHEDVQYFAVRDASGAAISHMYLDPYSRPATKRGGAWMGEVVGRSRAVVDDALAPALPGGVATRLPVAHMVCNGSPPTNGKPSLMTFREVETLFHEAGHALQHVLTNVDEGLAAGIREVEWDMVEVPSQFMENWVYDERTLMSFARHFETREPLPREEYAKLVAARSFRSASALLRQVHFASLDLELHAGPGAGPGAAYDADAILALEGRVAAETSVLEPLAEDRFLCAFSHIFAGGYAAGYYSYKWAEVGAADAFAAFEDVGLENDGAVAETGRRFRDTVLGMGGSRSADDVFRAFRGRDAEIGALLRHAGLSSSCAAGRSNGSG
jgi:oligopeptidase A